MKFLKSEKGKILSSSSANDVSRLARNYPLDLPPSAFHKGGGGR
jgi:hypothetical protein